MLMRFLFVFLFPALTWAWGGRGHDAICEAASFLVKDPGLKEFLRYRSHVMGHLCNVPDIYWKSLPPEVSKIGHATHFVDLEILGLRYEEIPLDYAQLMADFTGKENKFKPGTKIKSIPEDFGSLWWRVDEFVKKISVLDFKDVLPPADRKQEQDDKLPYNARIYDMMVWMGLMGHFTGDAAMPFHNSADYDGHHAGHGGVHAYYETDAVSQFGPELAQEVLKKAQSMKKMVFPKGASTLEKMRQFSILSLKDLPKILKLDPVTKKAKPGEMAGRKSVTEGYKAFKPLILEQLARASWLTAHLWEEAYIAAGKPDLSKYRSYRYPFTPDFVPPSYIKAQ